MISLRALVHVLLIQLSNFFSKWWLLRSWTNQRTLTSVWFMCCVSTYSGAEDNKVPQNIVLRTVIVHSSCSVDAIKWEVLRPKFLELWNGSCGLKTPCDQRVPNLELLQILRNLQATSVVSFKLFKLKVFAPNDPIYIEFALKQGEWLHWPVGF